MLSLIKPSVLARRADWGNEPAGYAHHLYPESLAEFGTPVHGKHSQAWLLQRKIPKSSRQDCIGPYPLFTCEDIDGLGADFEKLGQDVVSVAVVPDPFTVAAPKSLADAFDIVIPFKSHYLVDLEIKFSSYLHRHHRRYAKRGLSKSDVRLAQTPSDYAEEWVHLYQHLVSRHRITGLRAFTPRALSLQLSVPGCHYFRAIHDECVQGALVCYLDRGVAYAHLVSTTPAGQKLFAQYALYWHAIEYFRGSAKWFALGSIPGSTDIGGAAGLAFFKAGWATATCQAYFCGRIQDPNEYDNLCALFGRPDSVQFPGYRMGPFE